MTKPLTKQQVKRAILRIEELSNQGSFDKSLIDEIIRVALSTSKQNDIRASFRRVLTKASAAGKGEQVVGAVIARISRVEPDEANLVVGLFEDPDASMKRLLSVHIGILLDAALELLRCDGADADVAVRILLKLAHSVGLQGAAIGRFLDVVMAAIEKGNEGALDDSVFKAAMKLDSGRMLSVRCVSHSAHVEGYIHAGFAAQILQTAVDRMREATVEGDHKTLNYWASGLLSVFEYGSPRDTRALKPHVARHVSILIDLAERLLNEAEPELRMGDNPRGLAVSTLIGLAIETGAVTDDLSERAARARFRQATEQPATNATISMNALQPLGSRSVPLLIDLMRRWLPDTGIKEALSGLAYSSYDGALAYVEEAIYELVAHKDKKSAAAALADYARTWSDDHIGVFLAVVTSDAHYEDDTTWSKRGKFVAHILPVIAPQARKARSTAALFKRAEQSFGAAPVFTPPATLPTSVSEAFDLVQACGLDDESLGITSPCPSEQIAALAEPLRGLFAQTDGLGVRSDGIPPVAKIKQLRKLQKDFVAAVKSSMRHPEDGCDDDAIDLRWLPPPEELVAFGTAQGGDIFFIDPSNEAPVPVLRFVHDEAVTARVEACSVGEFVARTILDQWERLVGGKKSIQRASWSRTTRALTTSLRSHYRSRSNA